MFKSPLHYRTLIKNELWQLEAPLVYEFTQTDYNGCYLKERKIIVPAGYVTDFYSIPKCLQGVWAKDHFPPHPAVVHDYILTHMFRVFTRTQADNVFYDAMRVMGVPWGRRNLFYLAVRLVDRQAHLKKRETQLKSLGHQCNRQGQICDHS